MKNIFFVPFSGRFDSFSAALCSIANSFQSCEKVLILIDVSNNIFLDRVNSIASSLFESSPCSSFILCERDNSLSIVESWFNSIFKHSCQGDLVHFLGDDDLLISGSLNLRAEVLSKADYAVYTCLSRIFFFPDAQYIADFANIPKFLNDKTAKLNTQSWNPCFDNLYQSFISICSFKVSSALRYNIYNFLDTLNKQYWLEPTFAHAMFFYLFPFYLHYSTSLVFAQTDLSVAIRGARIKDMFLNDYSDGGSRGLYLSSSLYVITNLLNLPSFVVDTQTNILSKYLLVAHTQSLYHPTYSSYVETLSRTSLASSFNSLNRNWFLHIISNMYTSHLFGRIRRLIFTISLHLKPVKIYYLPNLLKVLEGD